LAVGSYAQKALLAEKTKVRRESQLTTIEMSGLRQPPIRPPRAGDILACGCTPEKAWSYDGTRYLP
jgi:hypothetical protein